MKVTDSSIQSIKVDSSGKYVACGGHDGTISLLELSDALSDMQPNEKPNTNAVFERETNREKTVVARLREVHLKESVRARTALASAKEGDDDGEGEKKAMVRPCHPLSFPPFLLCLCCLLWLCWEHRASLLRLCADRRSTPHTIPIFTIHYLFLGNY